MGETGSEGGRKKRQAAKDESVGHMVSSEVFPTQRRHQWIVLVCGGYALLGGALTLFGWFGNVTRLRDWDGDGIAMFANTALMALAGGLALILAQARARVARGAWPFALIVLIFGCLTLLEHLTGRDFGIDELLIRDDSGSRAATSPGRPGPPASASFTVLAVAILLLRTRFRLFIPALGMITAAIALLSLVGYLFGADPLFAVSRYTGIAKQSASMILALAVGLIVSVPEQLPMRTFLENSAAGALVRRALPFIIGLPVLLGLLLLRGQEAVLFDGKMGTALLVIALILLLCVLLWWCAGLVSDRERVLRQKEESLIREIAERQRTEEALIGNQAMLKSITDNSADLIFVKDLDSRTVYINPAGVRMSGLPEDRILGRTDLEIYPEYPEQSAGFMAADRRIIESGMPETIEECARTADGRAFVFLTTKTPRLDAEGKIIGVIGIARDITERKRAEEELRLSADRAQAALRTKDEFLASLSHELRTPLTPALLTAAALEDDASLSGEVRSKLGVIRRNIQLEARLIDDLLDLTRVSRGKMALQPVVTNLRELIGFAQEAVAQDVIEKQLSMDFEFGAGECHVHADPARLQQVLWNLLKNAVKFTPPGGRITVKTFNPRAERVAVRVEDNGIGIAPEDMDSIFLAFNQGHTGNNHRFGGLGLGLAISKAIVEAHSGDLRAESEGPGKGAAFTLELEVVVAPTEVQPVAPLDERPRGLRLLLVEDHPATLDAIGLLLERDGHIVHRAGSVSQAVVQAEENVCDLVISDLGLPDGDGYEMMTRLRDRYGWPGIALSGYGMEADLKKSRDAGFSFHLIKPVPIAELRRVISQVMRRPEVE